VLFRSLSPKGLFGAFWRILQQKSRSIVNNKQCLRVIQVGVIAVGLGALSATSPAQAGVLSSPTVAAGIAVAAPDFSDGILVAADAGAAGASGPDQAAKPPAKPDQGDPAAAARESACKTQWSAADTNRDGIIDGAEIALYNKTVRAESQPVLADTDRLPEADFLATCTAVVAHE